MGKRAAAIILIMLCAGSARAQVRGERPVILRARVYVADSVLVTDLRSGYLFSPEVAGTIESGLPAVVELAFSLRNAKNRAIRGGVRTYELVYDVWEDHYVMQDADSTHYCATFEQMAGTVETLYGIAIAPVAALDPDAEYRIEFAIAVRPLRSREKRRIVGWVDENVQDESERSWRGRMLNINQLIKHFFAREDDVSDQSGWFVTDMFRPEALPERMTGETR